MEGKRSFSNTSFLLATRKELEYELIKSDNAIRSHDRNTQSIWDRAKDPNISEEEATWLDECL
jgi:hypothetical protein